MVSEVFTPYKISGTQIEIRRPFDGRKITRALFDFDGTLSMERDGWIPLMVEANSSALLSACPQLNRDKAFKWVVGDIEVSIGVPTYVQMKRLAEEIKSRNGQAKAPQFYKGVYNAKLVELVASKHRKISEGQLSLDDVRVKGSIDLLTRLRDRLGQDSLYLASGTDVQPIKESVGLLDYGAFFNEKNIIAAGSYNDPEIDAKELIIDELVKKHRLKPGQLLTFGDGYPELDYTNRVGGICVGLLTPQTHCYGGEHFTMQRKRERLIEAGAHVLVPDLSEAEDLLKVIFAASLPNDDFTALGIREETLLEKIARLPATVSERLGF